jgi:hypothetical protein
MFTSPDATEKLRQEFPRQSTQSAGYTAIEVPTASLNPQVAQQLQQLDPEQAGWESESISAAVSKQLDVVRLALESAPETAADKYASIAADGFQGELVPRSALVHRFNDGFCQAQRFDVSIRPCQPTSSIEAQFESLLPQSEVGNKLQADALRCSFKVTHITLQPDSATTRVLVQSLRRTAEEVLQTNATCQCEWSPDKSTPKLQTVKVLEYEEIRYAAGGRYLFEDVTEAVVPHASEVDAEVFREQVQRDIGYWSERLSAIDDMSIYGHHGLAVGDVNRDGLEDLYVCDSGGLPNRMYLQLPDGTLRDVSRESHADWLEATSAALLVDLDNDGDADLVAATAAGIVVAANDGSGVFAIRAAIPGMPESQSLCAADYDNDRNLDIYVTSYGPGGSTGGQRGFEATAPIPYHDANNGGRNVLLKNMGNFQFTDATQDCGLDVNNRRFSFSASWEDFDEDGDVDLYVANDFGRNNLYRNDGGTFHDVAAELGVEDMAGGMSACWGDSNQDGRMDIYVGNMYSAAGNRVTYQRRFLEGRSASSSAGIQRMARGNTLFMAKPDHTFADVSETAGVTMGRWAWSSKFADLNNDGREDLVVANGYFTNTLADDL